MGTGHYALHCIALHSPCLSALQASLSLTYSGIKDGQPHRELDLSQNALAEVGGLAALTSLRRLSLDRNQLTSLAGAAGGGLACARGLQSLSAANNTLASLSGALYYSACDKLPGNKHSCLEA